MIIQFQQSWEALSYNFPMRRFLFLGVFTAGCISLAVELSASRLLGNYFGSSNLVWASVIGLILIYLSVGYSIGGKWADRSPRHRTFFTILVWASFLVGLIPLASRPILKFAGAAFDQLRLGAMAGSFITVLVIFSAPVILLGTASPFAVRLAIEDKDRSGSVAGKIYAISTLGSFIGTFLPVLVLIPAVGTYRTFLVLSGLLMLVAFAGLAKAENMKAVLRFLWMPFFLAVVSFFALRGPDKSAVNIIFEDESAYNYIQVQNIEGYHILRLNEGQGIHSIYHPDRISYGGPWEQVLTAPFFNPPSSKPEQVENIAILGLAAGTSANQAASVFPQADIDGFEIDPVIVDVGFNFFAMENSDPDIFIQDARWGLSASPVFYDIISVDAYRPPYIPWHLTTMEFFGEVKDRLVADGVLVINVARIFEDRRLLDALYQTIRSVFPSVYIVDLPNTLNSIIFATKAETDPENLIRNYISLSQKEGTPSVLLSALEIAITSQQSPPKTGMVLTDDRAPVEWIINRMMFDLFRSGGLGVLQ